jgi:hypothetical protein
MLVYFDYMTQIADSTFNPSIGVLTWLHSMGVIGVRWCGLVYGTGWCVDVVWCGALAAPCAVIEWCDVVLMWCVGGRSKKTDRMKDGQNI